MNYYYWIYYTYLGWNFFSVFQIVQLTRIVTMEPRVMSQEAIISARAHQDGRTKHVKTEVGIMFLYTLFCNELHVT